MQYLRLENFKGIIFICKTVMKSIQNIAGLQISFP